MRRKLIPLLLLAALALSAAGCSQSTPQTPPASNPPAAAAPTLSDLLNKGRQIEGLTYDMVMHSGGVEIAGKVWLQGKKFKTEVAAAGQKVITCLDGDKGEAYTYMPDRNIAIKLPAAPADQPEYKSPGDYIAALDPGVVKEEGTVTYNGYTCRVITYTDGADQVKLWLHAEHGIPVRVEVGADGSVLTLDCTNIQVGKLPDGTFALPAGVEWVTVPTP